MASVANDQRPFAPRVPELSFDIASLHGWQKAAVFAREPYCCVSAGYGSGKTTVGGVKFIYNATALDPKWPHLIVAPTWTTMKSVILRKLKALFMSAGFSQQRVKDLMYIHDPQDEKYLDWGDGTHIFLRSAKNPGSIEGLEVATLWMDEARLVTEEAYRIAVTRCRIRRANLVQRFLTTTPAMHWLATHYNTGRTGHRLIRGSTIDNLPNLDPDYVKGLKAAFSKRILRAILYGEFVPLEGSVYETFDPKLKSTMKMGGYRLDNYNTKREAHRHTQIWIDPGHRRAAVCWVRETGNPLEWVVFKQLMPTDQSMADTIAQINRINATEKIQIDSIWCDPAADIREQSNKISIAQLLTRIKRRGYGGVHWITGIYRDLVWGIERVRTTLGDPEEGNPTRLLFTGELIDKEQRNPTKYDNRGLVKSLQAYQYPEHKDGKPYDERPVKDGIHDHACLVGDTLIEQPCGKRVQLATLPETGVVKTPQGWQPYRKSYMGQQPVWRLRLLDGRTITATGDHKLAIGDYRYAPVLCTYDTKNNQRDEAGFQWRSVLALRGALLQSANVSRLKAATSSGVGTPSGPDTQRLPCAPQRPRQEQQQAKQLGVDRKQQTHQATHAGPCSTSAITRCDEESNRESAGMAPFSRRPQVAQRACETKRSEADSSSEAVPGVRRDLQDESTTAVEVLPSKLQSSSLSAATLVAVEYVGVRDVWDLNVPSTHCYYLANDVLTHNCDMIRYGCAGLWLSTGLREIHPVLRKAKAAGYTGIR